MKNIDVELIHRVLDGDDTAFTELVKKYQKPVHALVWRKIGDFHIAEEITQDTFLKAYRGLATLKKPQSFASWLYVIAANHCSTWLRKKRLQMQSLEETSRARLEKATYSGYVIAENERTAVEAQREVVKKLLSKLQESERTVITLHYFGEMSSAEIGTFLGVSANTVRSRLRRAQQRLRKEEPMIREALNNFQIAPHLTGNIMREIARMKPAVPAGGKPIVPWAITISTMAVVLLMLGVGSQQYLSRFQKPYSFDARSEMTVELIEAPIVLNLESEPDIRNQFGNEDAIGRDDGTHRNPDATLFSSASGHILDEAGKPVSGIKIAVTPMIDGNGAWFPIRGHEGALENAAALHVESDAEGRFTITESISGPVLLSLFPLRDSSVRMLRVQIGELLFYASGMMDRGIVFTPTPGESIENIEVTVQGPHIRAKVQRMDGRPITNARIRRRLRRVSLQGNSSGSGSEHTDAEGYFTHYVDRELKEPIFYMFSVTYQGQTVDADPILLKPGDPTHNIVFTFAGLPEEPLQARRRNFASASASTNSIAQNIWVIQPDFSRQTEGHAYKKIKCENWEAARTQAAAEGAYLVAINDAAEQKWLQTVFGNQPSWIGLNDTVQEGEWRWDNGEPLTYTNWEFQEPHDANNEDEDWVIMGPSGKWEDINPSDGQWRWIQTAIIEKKVSPMKK
ncbi:MAG: sigma-70 family RNA polymerase sigma factor [Candidatus Poribacteria bacterium]|nr:sigma-70 family RNA polymerase sigma factor [Candidatus Poribacteria bacterium]